MKKKPLFLLVLCIVLVLVGMVICSRRKAFPSEKPGQTKESAKPPSDKLPVQVRRKERPELPGKPAKPLEPGARRLAIQGELLKLNMSPSVRTIVELDENAKDWNVCREAIRKLTRKLPPDDVKALSLFLDTRYADQKGMSLLEFNALKNDLLDILLRQDELPDGLGGQLVRMFRDREHDDVWRDYCVQYMSAYYKLKWPTSNADANENPERNEIESAYWEAVTEKDKTIAGTSLIGLERLSRTHTEIDRGKIEKTAVELATDDHCHEGTRITAFRICGLMGKRDVLPSARVIAQTGETVPLRMAALATIGDLGDSGDLELVQSMVADSEKRIKTIAESALNHIKERQTGSMKKQESLAK